MSDLSWMLKPQAIRQAKLCIQLVNDELGYRLKLSHPQFLQELHKCVDQSGSRKLGDEYAKLIAMSVGVGAAMQNLNVDMTNQVQKVV